MVTIENRLSFEAIQPLAWRRTPEQGKRFSGGQQRL
jgi:hypothetical protein